MGEGTSIQPLPGSRVQCREVDGQLVLHLPSRPGRVLKATAGFVFALAALPVVGRYVAAGDAFVFGLFIVSLGVPLVVILLVWGTLAVQRHATGTFVLITRETLIVKTVLLGKEKIRKYALTGQSRASQLVQSPNEDPSPASGISITTKKGEVEFGEGLSQGERDWIEWRVNQCREDHLPSDPARDRLVANAADG